MLFFNALDFLVFFPPVFLARFQSHIHTRTEYADEHTLIPKNTSLVIARVPLAQKAKKHWHPSEDKQQLAAPPRPNARDKDAEQTHTDLSRMSGTEEDKINAMMIQSSLDYDPSK